MFQVSASTAQVSGRGLVDCGVMNAKGSDSKTLMRYLAFVSGLGLALTAGHWSLRHFRQRIGGIGPGQ